MRSHQTLGVTAGLFLTFLAVGTSDVRAQAVFFDGPVNAYSNQGFSQTYGSYGYGGYGPQFYGAGATNTRFGVGGYGMGMYGVPLYDAYYGQDATFYAPGYPYVSPPTFQPYGGAGRVGGLVPYVPRLNPAVPRLNPSVPMLR